MSEICNGGPNHCDSHTGGTTWKALEIQTSGHKVVCQDNGKQMLGIVDLGDGFILKALQQPPRGRRELNFYQEVWSQPCLDTDCLELRPFLPVFVGTVKKEDVNYLKLTNLTYGYHRPCVMDLKMGQITYDQEATPEKIASEIKKFPPLPQLGFQITGMIVFDPEMGTYVKYHKEYNRKLTEETIISKGLSLFFRLGKENSRADVLPFLLSKLRQLENWFLRQRKFSFIASSLLVIYEGDQQESSSVIRRQEDLSLSEQVQSCEDQDLMHSLHLSSKNALSPLDEVRLYFVDFAHVFPSTSIDNNVLFGIQKLIACVQTMMI